MPMFDVAHKENVSDRIYSEGIEARDSGASIIGVYCAFTPVEVIAAAGGIPVALCSGSNAVIPAAEAHLPRNLCPLIKSSYGHVLTHTCPYTEEVDLIFADVTCDGKKKMFELLSRVKDVRRLYLPQSYDAPQDHDYWLAQVRQLAEAVEQRSGVALTEDALRKQIRLYNDLRAAIQELFRVNTGEVPLAFGREIDAVMEEVGGFQCRLPERAANLRAAAAEIRAREHDTAWVRSMRRRPRILLTGCPNTNTKVLAAIEDAGGVVVAMESCGGLKTCGAMTPEDAPDPLSALASRYLRTACPCMTPNPLRLELLRDIARDYRVAGVIELVWEACHTYNVESFLVQEHVTGTLGLPYLQIGTDYSDNDSARIRLRVEAFLEMLPTG